MRVDNVFASRLIKRYVLTRPRDAPPHLRSQIQQSPNYVTTSPPI